MLRAPPVIGKNTGKSATRAMPDANAIVVRIVAMTCESAIKIAATNKSVSDQNRRRGQYAPENTISRHTAPRRIVDIIRHNDDKYQTFSPDSD